MSLNFSGHWTPPVEALGIGVFDGMHRGHQKIADLSTLLMTFYPHPDLVLNKKANVQWLSTAEELHALMSPLVTLRFTQEVAQYSAEDFLQKGILEKFAPKRLVVGYDFIFGHNKSGNVSMLKYWASERNIEVVVVPPVTHQGEVVRSSQIRRYFEAGEFNRAVDQLGHPYLIMGQVVHGEGRGHHLGFPTANLQLQAHKLLPAVGVYRAMVERDAQYYPAMAYIGRKPTFEGPHLLACEVHLIHQNRDLYHARLKLWLQEKIREEIKFESKEALIAQLQKDQNYCWENRHDFR